MHDIIKIIEHLENCSEFILEKATKMKENHQDWTVNDLFMFTDIVKDVSEIHKNICKMHKLRAYSEKLI